MSSYIIVCSLKIKALNALRRLWRRTMDVVFPDEKGGRVVPHRGPMVLMF